jgi:glutathione S-transferase
MSQSNVITLYDIISSTPAKAWSPNTGKIRSILNYKDLEHKTVWVEFPDIADFCQKIGAPPSGKKADGSDEYTFPVIYDPSTGSTVSDSLGIALYLEKTYPAKPIFPAGTAALQAAFGAAYLGLIPRLFHLGYPAIHAQQTPRGQEYIRRTREEIYGAKLEELAPVGSAARAGHWGAFKAGLDTVDAWLAHSPGPYVLGNTPSYADFHVATLIAWLEPLFGHDSQEWKDVTTWNNGRWAKLVEALKPYTVVRE